MIYPSIRAVAVGFNGLETLKVVIYLDREPNESDFEYLSDIAGEILADINFNSVEEVCLFSEAHLSALDDGLIAWVYMRMESEML